MHRIQLKKRENKNKTKDFSFSLSSFPLSESCCLRCFELPSTADVVIELDLTHDQ